MSIHTALVSIMKDVGAIGKTKKNQQQGFQFRGIDDAYNALHDVMARHGVVSVPIVLSERSEERQTKNGGALIYRILTIKYSFFAEDGTFVEAVVIGEGMDSGDKAASKAMAIAHKYALLQVFCIPTEETDDPDKEAYEVKEKQQPTHPVKMATREQMDEIERLANLFTCKQADYVNKQLAQTLTHEKAEKIIEKVKKSLKE